MTYRLEVRCRCRKRGSKEQFPLLSCLQAGSQGGKGTWQSWVCWPHIRQNDTGRLDVHGLWTVSLVAVFPKSLNNNLEEEKIQKKTFSKAYR